MGLLLLVLMSVVGAGWSFYPCLHAGAALYLYVQAVAEHG